MKNSITRTAAAILLAAAVAAGCSEKTVEESGKPESRYYELNGGELRYSVTDALTEFESEQSGRSFDVKGSEGEISVLELPRLHQTAKGYAGDMAEIYELDGSYSNIRVEEDMTSGIEPTYRITASAEDGFEMAMDIVQYGDSVLFGILSTYPAGDSICTAEVKKILDSVEYNGAPRKTETELFESELFTASVSPDWYIVDDGIQGNGDLTVSYNRYDDYRLSANSFSLMPVSDSKRDAEFMADMLYIGACESYEEDSSVMTKPERSTEKLFGCDAGKVTYTVVSEDISMTRMSWYFEVNGRLFEAELSCPDLYTEKYLADLRPLIDSVQFGNW